jgi:hypothetical protein
MKLLNKMLVVFNKLLDSRHNFKHAADPEEDMQLPNTAFNKPPDFRHSYEHAILAMEKT